MVISLLTLSLANATTKDGSNASRSTQLFKSKDVQPKHNLIARAHKVESFDDSTLKIRQLTTPRANSRSLSVLSGFFQFLLVTGLTIAVLTHFATTTTTAVATVRNDGDVESGNDGDVESGNDGDVESVDVFGDESSDESIDVFGDESSDESSDGLVTRESPSKLTEFTSYMSSDEIRRFQSANCPLVSVPPADARGQADGLKKRPDKKLSSNEPRVVVVMSVGQKRIDITRLNAHHFQKHNFQVILGHYDKNATLFEQEEWYADPGLVVHKEIKRYTTKYNLLDDLIRNNRSLLNQYDYVLVPDEDFLWPPVNLTCYVNKAKRFAITGPAVVGPHLLSVQTPELTDTSSGSRCPERKVNAIEVQSPMFQTKHLSKLESLFLEENRDPEGELESAWCLDMLWCEVVGTCGVVETCGNPIHCDTKTLNKDNKYMQAAMRNCENLEKKFSPTKSIWSAKEQPRFQCA